MKTHTPPVPTPARKRKPAARKGSRQPAAKTLALPLPAVPTVWKIAAADLGFKSVEEWAAAMLDIMSWPGNRLTITPAQGQLDRWMKAGRAQDLNLHKWLEATLDAASEAVKPQTSTQS